MLVNSAGFNVAARRWHELTPDDFDRVLASNLSGAFYAVNAVLPAMRSQKDGPIVNGPPGTAPSPERIEQTRSAPVIPAFAGMTGYRVRTLGGLSGVLLCLTRLDDQLAEFSNAVQCM